MRAVSGIPKLVRSDDDNTLIAVLSVRSQNEWRSPHLAKSSGAASEFETFPSHLEAAAPFILLLVGMAS